MKPPPVCPHRRPWFPACCALLLLVGCAVAARAYDAVPEGGAAPGVVWAYVTHGGYSRPSGVSRFVVDGRGGVLVPATPAAAPADLPGAPARIVIHPGRRFAYVAHAGDGRLMIRPYRIGGDGAFVPLAPAAAPRMPEGETAPWFALTPDGRSGYTVARKSDTLWRYAVDAQTGALSVVTRDAVEALDAPPGASSLVFAPGGGFAYAVGDRRIGQYRVVAGGSGGDGVLAPLSPPSVDLGTSWPYPRPLVLRPDGRTAYVISNGAGVVRQFRIGADGVMAPLTPAAVSLGQNAAPVEMAITPDGRFAYLIYSTGNKIITPFRVGEDGALSPLASGAIPTGDDPESIAVDPSGRWLYVLCRVNNASAGKEDAGTIWQYQVGDDGALSPLSPARLELSDVPRAIAFLRRGTP